MPILGNRIPPGPKGLPILGAALDLRDDPLHSMRAMVRDYGDVVDHLKAWFEGRVELARELGVAEEQIAIDPGLDFDLSPDQDLEILRRLGELRSLGLPLYVSLSRKDFIGAVLAGSWEKRLPPAEREWGTVAAVSLAVQQGAGILRIHDRSSLQAVRMAGRIARPLG